MRNNITPRNAPQVVSYDGSVACTNAFGANTKYLRVVATTACYLAFGTTPTADSTGIYLPAGVVEVFGVKPLEKIAAIKVASAGILSITEGEV